MRFSAGETTIAGDLVLLAFDLGVLSNLFFITLSQATICLLAVLVTSLGGEAEEEDDWGGDRERTEGKRWSQGGNG